MWKVVRENPRAVIYAVLMHLVLLALLVIGLDWTPSTKPAGSKPIQAELIDPNQLKALEDKKLAEQGKVEEVKQQKAEAEQKRKVEQEKKQKAETERKRKAEQVKKQKVEAERKLKAEQVKKQKAEAERKRKAEQIAKQKAEAERKAREAAEQALQAEIAAEQQREQDAREQGVVAEYAGYIQDKVRRNWVRPPGGPDDFTCKVQVSLIPGGDVAKARVVQSCGSAVLDRSVEAAVFKAVPLPVPEGSALFRHFRELNFEFRP